VFIFRGDLHFGKLYIDFRGAFIFVTKQ